MTKKDFNFSEFQSPVATGMDSFFASNPEIVTPVQRRKVASIQDLKGFDRVSNETLIHKADRDLWSLKRNTDGSMFVERMFDDFGKPLKG